MIGPGDPATVITAPDAAVNEPLPSPSMTVTVQLPRSLMPVTAKSSLPSPLKSPAAIACGNPTGDEAPGAAAKPPLPSPSITVTLLRLTIAKSSLPSPLKSLFATATGRPLKQGLAGTAVSPLEGASTRKLSVTGVAAK